ncbi:MAG: peptidylprolyl isomerase [Bacteroidales bacterium]|nr:peptidylprolyl isomerase [Bacteroidales bacterium]
MIKRILSAVYIISLCLVPFYGKAQVYEQGLIDKNVALIGNDAIFISDIEDEVQMMRMSGYVADRNARCEILENLMISKLFVTQARRDSLVVTDAEIQENINNRMIQAMQALGGEQEVLDYFGKPIYELRDEWYRAIEEQLLIQQMQRKVVQNVPRMTPDAIRQYVENTAQEDLPIVPTQYRLSQIVLYPEKEAANTACKETLLDLRERILNGERFSSLARIYSEDPGSAAKGGELGMMARSVYWPAFADAAMSLKEGQVSQVVETPDGFHIIQMIEKSGDMFNARHILIKPKYTSEDRNKAFAKLDSIRTMIVDSALVTFPAAAWMFSQDPKTRTNGGVMVDEMTGSAVFEKDQLKPTDYTAIKDLEVGGISEPFESLDNEGRGNTIYKIVKVDSIVPAHTASYDTDYNLLVDDANSKNANAAIEAFIKENAASTYIKLDPLYSGCNFQYSGWIH